MQIMFLIGCDTQNKTQHMVNNMIVSISVELSSLYCGRWVKTEHFRTLYHRVAGGTL